MTGIHPVTLTAAIVLVASGGTAAIWQGNPIWALVGAIAGITALCALNVARQWQRAVVLRLGKFYSLKGPGFFGVIPFIDTVAYWIDLRTVTAPFAAEQTLTKDSVPVDVDAVLFWRVIEPIKAALEVENYHEAITWSSQTALRDAIGETDLAEMLIGRQKIDAKLCKMIDARMESWGIKALSVEIRDVKIPSGLQNAMSLQAQAERERQARLILGDSELQIASKFHEASRSYAGNPVALHLRAMNILLEGMRQKSTVVIVPSRTVDLSPGRG